MKIALLGCTKRKRKEECKAIDMYDASAHYSKRLSYAQDVLKVDEVYILSAKHHLLSKTEKIEPYDVCLADFNKQEKIAWAKTVCQEICSKITLSDEIHILAGKLYCQDLVELLRQNGYKNIVLDLEGKGANGGQMHWLDLQLGGKV